MYGANVTERRQLNPPLAVSTVVFTMRPDATGVPTLHLPLVRRGRAPYLGQWALPGGSLRGDESLREAAATWLSETTGLTPTLLEQLYTFGGIDRGLGARTVSVVYWALVRDTGAALVSDPDVAWFPATDSAVLEGLAFDHRQIVEYALARLRAKVEYAAVAHRLLGDTFTLGQLREVHEAILGETLDPANFRRTALSRGDLEDTGAVLAGVSNRPPRLYRALPLAESPLPDPEGDLS